MLQYIERERRRIEGNHERFRSLGKLDATAWGVQEHYQGCRLHKQALL